MLISRGIWPSRSRSSREEHGRLQGGERRRERFKAAISNWERFRGRSRLDLEAEAGGETSFLGEGGIGITNNGHSFHHSQLLPHRSSCVPLLFLRVSSTDLLVVKAFRSQKFSSCRHDTNHVLSSHLYMKVSKSPRSSPGRLESGQRR